MNCLAGKLREAYKILFCIRERMKSVKLSIVVPCYNEKENLPLLLERFNEVIKGRDMEVILVDNGSTDGSADVLRELLPRYAFAKIVTVEVNQG